MRTGQEALQEAAAYLAALDEDHAEFENSVGYSKSDGSFGHALARLPLDQWSVEITRDAWEMLRRYRRQLTSAGIDLDTVPEPGTYDTAYVDVYNEWGTQRVAPGRHAARQLAPRPAAPKVTKADPVRTVSLVGGELHVTYEYDGALVADCRNITGRRYNGSTNVIPTSSIGEVREFVARHGGFTVAPEVDALVAVEKPADGLFLDAKGVFARFPYNPDHVVGIKAAVPGASFKKEEGSIWRLSVNAATAPTLSAWAEKVGLAVSAEVRALMDGAITAAMENREASYALGGEITIPGLAPGAVLKPYQPGAIAYASKNRRCFIADEMGLGKTLEASGAVVLNGAYPCIVAMPAVAKVNWAKEIRKFFPDATVSIQLGSAARRRLLDRMARLGVQVFRSPEDLMGPDAARFRTDFVLVNYDVLLAHADGLAAMAPQALILDESHKVKNGTKKYRCPDCDARVAWNAKKCAPQPERGRTPRPCGATFESVGVQWSVQRTDASARIAREVPDEGMVLLLTGTPITLRTKDLVAQLEIMGRLADFGGRSGMERRYCGGHLDDRGHWVADGDTNTEELHERLRATCYIRRTLADVYGDDVPERLDYDQLVEGDAKAMVEYERAEDDLVEFLAERAAQLAAEAGDDPTAAKWQARLRAEAAEHLARFAVLRTLVGKAKVKPAIEWVQNWLDENDGKLLVFGEHTAVVKGIAAKFGAPVIMGGVGDSERQDAEEAFQNDPSCRLMVCNITAASVALTLTAASDVLFVELAWSVTDHDQAVARCFGRASDLHGVKVWWLLCDGTIDGDELWPRLQENRIVVDGVTDGVTGAKGKASVFGDVLVSMAERALARRKVSA